MHSLCLGGTLPIYRRLNWFMTKLRKYNLNHASPNSPEGWGERGKKREIIPISAIVPNPGPMTEEEWLQEYGNKQPEQKGKS